MKTYIIVILLLILAVIGWHQANSQKQEIAVRDATIDNLMVSLRQAEDKPPEIQTVVVEKLVEVEKVVYLDRTVEKYKVLTDFQNLADLQQFVDSIGIIVVFNETGLLGCYDNALFYWRKAYEQGKRVYIQSVEPPEYNRYFTKRTQQPDEGHIVISAVIGRQLYWVDPSSAEVILRGELLK